MTGRFISLPIIWHNDDTRKAEETGTDNDLGMRDYDLRMVDFYEVSAVAPYQEDRKVIGSRVFSGGETFLSPLMKKQIRLLMYESSRADNFDDWIEKQKTMLDSFDKSNQNKTNKNQQL